MNISTAGGIIPGNMPSGHAVRIKDTATTVETVRDSLKGAFPSFRAGPIPGAWRRVRGGFPAGFGAGIGKAFDAAWPLVAAAYARANFFLRGHLPTALVLMLGVLISSMQREALEALDTGQQGCAYLEITAAVCPNRLDPMVAPITLEIDRQQRRAHLSIPDIGESRSEPIRNPVSGEEHRARIVLPNGFEYEEAEMGNTVSFNVRAGGQLEFQHENCYAQFNAFDWSNG